MIARRALLAGLAGVCALPARDAIAAGPLLLLSGPFVQGGGVIGRTRPGAQVILDGQPVGHASPAGLFFIGFDRDAPAQATIAVRHPEGQAEHTAQIAPGDFDVQRIDGLPQNTVTPEGPALLARIAEENRRKGIGFASHSDTDDYAGGFIVPLRYTRLSGRFGGQRILNGVPLRPHYGTDLAAPIGTPIVAPAPGVVSFAETGLHFEGGLTMIDHGEGLISVYLHQSRVDVQSGQRVVRGQLIGAVGKEGRATGPHLCWRLKWNGRNLDPMRLIGVTAPPLL